MWKDAPESIIQVESWHATLIWPLSYTLTTSLSLLAKTLLSHPHAQTRPSVVSSKSLSCGSFPTIVADYTPNSTLPRTQRLVTNVDLREHKNLRISVSSLSYSACQLPPCSRSPSHATLSCWELLPSSTRCSIVSSSGAVSAPHWWIWFPYPSTGWCSPWNDSCALSMWC